MIFAERDCTAFAHARALSASNEMVVGVAGDVEQILCSVAKVAPIGTTPSVVIIIFVEMPSIDKRVSFHLLQPCRVSL
jgi:hypothetical protein